MDEISPGPLARRVIDLLNRCSVTAILATVDPAGHPWTTPVNTIASMSERAIRMALTRNGSALAHIQRCENVMIAILDEGDIAVGIAGRAHVVRQMMDSNPLMAMVEVEVEGAKDDTWPDLVVCQGIRTRHKREGVTLFFRNMFRELRS